MKDSTQPQNSSGRSATDQEVRMSEDGPTGAGDVPPPATLLQMMTGYWVSQALYFDKAPNDLRVSTSINASLIFRMRAKCGINARLSPDQLLNCQ